MSKVVTRRDWHCIDELDNVPLREGEALRVLWPDGVVEALRVRIDEKSEHYQEHGGGSTIVTKKAYASILYHGAESRVYLSGVEAERVG